MKTLNKKFNTTVRLALWVITCMLVIISTQHGISQVKKLPDHDYLMPHKGKSMILFNSGIPYVAIGEYSYAISNRCAVGILYGYTPIVLGYGLRVKAIIAQPNEQVRIILKTPMIYYPHTKNLGGDPWVLAWPTLTIEKKLNKGTRIWAGLGMIGASCVDALLGERKETSMVVVPGTDQGNTNQGIMSAVWNTIQLGYSKPLSHKLSWTIEVAPVLKGLKLAGDEWIAGPPLILTLGASYSL